MSHAMPPSLSELQRQLKRAITETAEKSPALAWIDSDARGSGESRIGIYAEAWLARLVDSLAADFPSFKHALEHHYEGEAFSRVIEDFLRAFPSRVPNIGNVGKRLPGFLASHSSLGDEPWLAELARLEWELIAAFHAENTPPFDQDALARLRRDEWDSIRFRLSPSVRTLESPWNVEALWRDPTAPPIRADSAKIFLIWRRHWRATVEPLESRQALVLGLIRYGKPLGEILEHWPGDDGDEVMRLFRDWISSGVVQGIETECPSSRFKIF